MASAQTLRLLVCLSVCSLTCSVHTQVLVQGVHTHSTACEFILSCRSDFHSNSQSQPSVPGEQPPVHRAGRCQTTATAMAQLPVSRSLSLLPAAVRAAPSSGATGHPFEVNHGGTPSPRPCPVLPGSAAQLRLARLIAARLENNSRCSRTKVFSALVGAETKYLGVSPKLVTFGFLLRAFTSSLC